MPFPYVHSFARQVLAQQGCKIFSNDAQILTPFRGPYGGEIYKISEVRTKIPIGTKEFLPSEHVMKITNYQKLLNFGYKIVSTPFTGWFPGQKQKHELVKMSSIRVGLKDMPPEHYVEYDLLNKAIRLLGRTASWNKVGPWTLLNKISDSASGDKDFVSKYLKDRDRLVGKSERKNYLNIPQNHIPVLIDEVGRIICIEEQTNEPSVGIVGQRRMGNSWFMHALTDRAYWKWNKHIAVMNDALDETKTWCMPWQEHPAQPNVWIRELKKLSEPTLPLPCVYLTPNHIGLSNDPESGDVVWPAEVGFKTALPFKEMVASPEKWDEFTKGNKRWSYKQSMTYFRRLFFNDDGTRNEDAVNITEYSEFVALMDEHWPEEDKKFESIRMKVDNTMRDIWNHQILDVTCGVASKWKVELPDKTSFEVDPFVAALACNLVPVLITKKIRTFSHFPQEFRYRLKQIFDAQVDNPYFKKNAIQTWLVVDEILSIAATDNKTVAAEEIVTVVRESGPARMGFVYRAQHYNKVLKELRENTGYCFAFKQFEESAKQILKDFGYPTKKSNVEELTSLKRYECVGFTNNYFIAYDPVTGDSEKIADRSVKGTRIPSLSFHKPPKEYGV